jgi:hypothetical protein
MTAPERLNTRQSAIHHFPPRAPQRNVEVRSNCDNDSHQALAAVPAVQLPRRHASRGEWRLPLRSRRHSPHIQYLPSYLPVYFYSAPLVWFYSALDITPSTVIGSPMARTLLSVFVNAGHEGRSGLFGLPDLAKLTQ